MKRDGHEHGHKHQLNQVLYHCRDHYGLPPVAADDEHFQEDHGGKDPSQLRRRCRGANCSKCQQQKAQDEFNLFKDFHRSQQAQKKAPTKEDNTETLEDNNSEEDL